MPSTETVNTDAAVNNEASPAEMSDPSNMLMGKCENNENHADAADSTFELETKDSDSAGDSEEDTDWGAHFHSLPLILEYRKVDFENFKNYYGADSRKHVIDALMVGPQTPREIKDELVRRQKRNTPPTEAKVSIDSPDAWIQRVRINSVVVLLYLENAAIIGQDWGRDYPRTFFRPFRTFICCHSRMKMALMALENKWGKTERLASEEKDAKKEPETEPEASGLIHMWNNDDDEEDEYDAYKSVNLNEGITGSVDALRHMQAYVTFVDKEIMPLCHMFEGTSRKKVRFNDLWFLFRAGEIVYSVDTEVSRRQKRSTSRSSTYQTTWRVHSTELGRIKDEKPDDIGSSKRVVVVNCHYIDFDGDSYGPVNHSFTIKYFEGEEDITRLSLYPIRFSEQAKAMLDQLRDQGRRFQSCIKTRHLVYQGWNLLKTPTGNPIGDKNHIEHIESNVIVDFLEGFQHFSAHKPSFDTPLDEENEWDRGDDVFLIIYWSDISRQTVLHRVTEDAQLVEGNIGGKKTRKVKRKMDTLGEDDLILLPRRLVAYVLRERRFAMLDIDSFSPIKQQKNIFDNLKIDSNHKLLVNKLTRAHFLKKEVLNRGIQVSMNQDIVQGKGLGLVILLHGVPGVGKTATAEAVAQTNGKPLFVITCGDLGTTPTEVEESLNEIFRLAHLWDCVLLLDEADVFLSKRETSALKRNALVSVFLRVLEYYSGILFLTTNRVGTLDEAFKSRIHVSLYYEPLKRKQTLDIFKVNISKLEEMEKERIESVQDMEHHKSTLEIDGESILDYAKWYYDNNHSSRWNGRQIRNAFQVASSIAYYDMHKYLLEGGDDKDNDDKVAHSVPRAPQSTLSWQQFQLVANTFQQFSTYMEEATNGTPDDIAVTNGLRASDSSYKASLHANRPPYIPREERQTSHSSASTVHERLSPRGGGGDEGMGGEASMEEAFGRLQAQTGINQHHPEAPGVER